MSKASSPVRHFKLKGFGQSLEDLLKLFFTWFYKDSQSGLRIYCTFKAEIKKKSLVYSDHAQSRTSKQGYTHTPQDFVTPTPRIPESAS